MAFVKKEYSVRGTVQGVGFRPAVQRAASRSGLSGFVQNRSGSVTIVLKGRSENISSFLKSLPHELPFPAHIDELIHISTVDVPENEALEEFLIVESRAEEDYSVSFPPDLAACPECLREVFDPENRRYGYPFATCTKCGPRYTVIEGMPYDRERTTLRHFPLCEECRAEYTDPHGRRFHAESTACPRCGPRLSRPLAEARRAIAEGEIVAVRGIGGFLLAIDAFNEQSILKLRLRKERPNKPLAVMARGISTVEKFCIVNKEAKDLLSSVEAPIVVLDVRGEAAGGFPLHALSPDTRTLGVMLPYSPLHHLLFHPLQGDPTPPFEMLVMTSGNKRSEPICITNGEAAERLDGIADIFLTHNREITLRADDSLAAVQGTKSQIWRRARGYAPRSLHTRAPISCVTLAMGAEQKNAIALGFEREIVLSPHIGDLETPEAVAGLEKAMQTFPEFLRRKPERVAVDLHPDMHSSILGRKFAEKAEIPCVIVQHHYAHGLACMAEHGLEESLALVFDGLGLGTDGTIWGAELLHCTRSEFKRLAAFEGVPLPGGDAAVLDPRRQLFARAPLNDEWKKHLNISDEEAAVWSAQILKGINCPVTHAAGRVFDAVSVLLGAAPERATYDGQSAIRLEALARRCSSAGRPELRAGESEADGMLVMEWGSTFRMMLERKDVGEKSAEYAFAFHEAVSGAAFRMIEYGMAKTGVHTVCISGGVFMNRILMELLSHRLEGAKIDFFLHSTVPPNDGGIAAGQAYSL